MSMFVRTLAAGLLTLGVAPLAARDKTQTIGDLTSKPVEIRRDASVESSAARAMENYRKFLALQKTDPKLRAEALRRLGDLNLESGELERMASEITLIDVQGAEAIKLYTTLLAAYPDYERNDAVLYQLARAYETTAQSTQALATLDRVVALYPQSPQIDEVQFRRGEILFSAKRYAEAQDAYEKVIPKGRASPFYSQSLYKHGWSLFKQSLNAESLPSFGSVLDNTLTNPRAANAFVPPEKLTRANRELVDDTLRVMSITFSDDEAAKGLEKFLGQRGAPVYSHLMYSRLGDLYIEKQRFQDAASTYRAFVGKNPNSDFAPGLAMQGIEAYRKGGFAQLVLDGEREFVNLYKFGGPFWQNRERAAHPEVVQQLKVSLKNVATWYHATAQASKKVDDYLIAAQGYRDLLESFPAENDTAVNRYLLADTLFEGQRYADASVEYQRTAYDYARNDKSSAAGFASIVARDKHRDALQGEERAQWHLGSIDAGIRFAQTFPEHPQSSAVITRAAQDVFALPDLPRAIDVSRRVLTHPNVDLPKQRVAWTIIAQSQFELGQFAEAEQAFVSARDLLPPDDKMRKELTERLATSVYRQAEAKRAAGDLNAAVDDFLRVAAVAPDSPVRATAEYDAASALVNLKSWDRAITVLTAYRRNYPNSQYQREVTRNLAVAYNETGRSGEAATEFEKISLDTREESAVRREALLSAVDAFEKTGNEGKTSGLLERFVGEYPRPVGEAIEARQKLADFAAKRNDEPKLTFWRREIIKADASAGAERNDRSKTLAARAQLALAEPARDAFNRIRLTLPLKKSLDAKRKSLDAAIVGYRAAADYRVGEVSSAASFQIAELYRRLAKDLLASERPKKLDKDSLEQYNLLLEEQAFPFEEQSIELHEVNAARVREGWYDAGVRSSFGALAELKPARFGKTEVGIKPGLEPTVDPAEAEKSARAAIASNAQDANAWVALGVSLRQQGKFAAAQEAYDKAILADPTNYAAHRNLGVLLDLYLDQPIPALASLERYKELSGEDKPVSAWIAELRSRVAKLQPPAPTVPAEGSTSVEGTAPPAGSAPVEGTPGNGAAPAPAPSANTPPPQEAA